MGYTLVMSIRTRKLIGTIMMVSFSSFYFFVAVTAAIVRLQDAPGWMHALFYLIITAIWFVIAAAIIWWMQKPAPAAKPVIER
ncbi:MAG: DUF2842 domain-containing protein [Hyphomicrobiales bacterium]|nr:DUF2842 domain-containing protein [Hyphomicrobiales bacterium]